MIWPALLVGGLVVIVALLVRSQTPEGETGTPYRSAPTPSMNDEVVERGGDPRAEPASSQGRSPSTKQLRRLMLDGFGGDGFSAGAASHRVRLTVSSRVAAGTVGYVVPTSANESYGIVHDVGTSWSLTTTGYGAPDFARVFVQSGLRGHPVTCTVRVDGKVTDRRTAAGPYGQAMCQG